MKSINYKMRTNFAIQESKNIKSAGNRIKKIPIDCKMITNFAIQESKNIKSATNRIKKY